MALNAFKNGTVSEGGTVFNEDNMNALQSSQNKVVIREGTEIDSKTGAGTDELSIADYNYCARFTLTGVTALDRIELDLDRDNLGVDLVVQIRSGMDPAAGDDGTLLKQIVVPKEFIPESAAYWSVPIDLTDLTEDAYYWIAVVKAGDATNKLDWLGEAAADGDYPAYYRAGDSGAWTAANSRHIKIYSGESGKLKHVNYGDNGWKTIERDGYGRISKIYRYLPPASGPEDGIRNINTISYVNGRFKRGVVS